ncbi:MAG: hypothetical protein LBM98_11745 [Oscillospiraceae bacterium]|nr:hypothetical protein [Oscillospiraceae bacterium]
MFQTFRPGAVRRLRPGAVRRLRPGAVRRLRPGAVRRLVPAPCAAFVPAHCAVYVPAPRAVFASRGTLAIRRKYSGEAIQCRGHNIRLTCLRILGYYVNPGLLCRISSLRVASAVAASQ